MISCGSDVDRHGDRRYDRLHVELRRHFTAEQRAGQIEIEGVKGRHVRNQAHDSLREMTVSAMQIALMKEWAHAPVRMSADAVTQKLSQSLG